MLNTNYMNKQDEKIKELWDTVIAKKEAIHKAEKPNWITNCSFSFSRSGNVQDTSNIQTISDTKFFVEALGFLMQSEDSFDKAAAELGVKSTFQWRGYSVNDWKTDFKTRIDKIKIADKKKELAALEARLGAIISPELKAELELAEIQKIMDAQ